ncbi:MAG: hypothetical protein ACREKH_12765, partial [Candidatus Rokuibacteriota bacterium]
IPSSLGANPRFGFGDFYSALAYGGHKGATEHADVIYAAKGNKVHVRLAGGAFETHTLDGAGQIRGIVLDPQDWETAYAIDSNRVYKTTDHGQNWAVISQGLGVTSLLSLEMVEAAGGAKALLVGTPLGVFRALNPAPNVQWTEFGRGLPNALVADIDFADLTGTQRDVLLAGTQGRGAWTILGDVAAFLGQESVLQVQGTAAADAFVVRRSPLNPSLVEVFVNSVSPVFTAPLTSLERIEFEGLGGNDTLEVDSSEGAITVPDGIMFDGGAGSDALVLNGGKTSSIDTDVAGAQTILTIVDHASDATQIVKYEGVELVTNNLPEASTLEKIGDALEEFFRWIGLIRDPGQGAESELAVLGSSLPRALVGTEVSGPIPLSDPG